MKFSVIIPTLNEEKLLPQLLEKLNSKSQKIKYDYEIIVSDGGSSDNTIIEAEKIADKVIRNNSGNSQNISIGRNLGAEQAEGDILIFLNGDIRIYKPDKLFDLINRYFTNSDFLAMTCCVKVFPEEEIFVDRIFQTFYNYYFHFLNIIGLGMGRGECHIIKKDVFKKFNGYNEYLAAGEDFDLYRRIRKEGKILFTRDFVVYESPRRYRKHGHLRILLTWLLNSISIFFTNSSLSKEWEQVR